jgi:hypothetical protein
VTDRLAEIDRKLAEGYYSPEDDVAFLLAENERLRAAMQNLADDLQDAANAWREFAAPPIQEKP